MKLLIVLLPLITISLAQRPSYAGTRPIGKPELASRFRDPNEETSTITLGSRLGENSGTTSRIPVDARGDNELVDRLNEWPRENRPFWLLNFEQIENQRNQRPTAPPVQSRFAESETIPVRPELPVPSFLSNQRQRT
nr:uncharacterized protein LOC111425232 [Onthophagus taurus]